MKTDHRWAYLALGILLLGVLVLEYNRSKTISTLTKQILTLQNEVDKGVLKLKNKEAEPLSYMFDTRHLCSRGVQKQVVIINEENKLRFYDEIKKYPDDLVEENPTLSGFVRMEGRKTRIFIKEGQDYNLNHFGYIYDWDASGIVIGMETDREVFHSDFCSGEAK